MVLVYKTSVLSILDVEGLKPILDRQLLHAKWNFDLEDCDRILRIESVENVGSCAIKILQENGFDCEELGD